MDFLINILEEALCVGKFYLIVLHNGYHLIAEFLDKKLDHLSPSTLIIGCLFIIYLSNIFSKNLAILYNKTSKKNILYNIRQLPIISTIVERKLDKIGVDMRKDLLSAYQNEDFVSTLPKKSSSNELILKKVKHYQMFDTLNWQEGRISGAIYTNNNSRLNDLLVSVFASNMWSNPLHSDVFASIRKMESEIIRMVASMYNGNPDVVIGSVTSGGTESIIMACKAYRDYGINVKGINGIPEIIVPITAHAAFEKGAKMLNCKIVYIPVDKKTYKVDLKVMSKAINKNTCMLVGSTPQFPHGILDPISEIAKLGLVNQVPVHVDACLGGFLIPFMERAGHNLDERFDFTIPGVTSISADTHKYGYAPKGTSVILYSDKKFIHQQYSVQTDWPGGIYASPTLPGSRPGALIATCWAAMMYHGLEGYVEATDKIIKTTNWIRNELSYVEGLKIMGNPQVSVLAFASDRFDIYAMSGQLKELGWNLNALQFPSAFHICITLMHTDNNVASNFVKDVKAVAKQLMLQPSQKATGSAAIYGMAQTLPDRSLVSQICTKYLDSCLGH